jgi:hypothetical protein
MAYTYLKKTTDGQCSKITEQCTTMDSVFNNYFGQDSYYNIKKGIVLKSNDLGNGLYAEQDIPKNTLVWKNRDDGPAEKLYHRVKIDEVEGLSPEKKKVFIKYSYQQTDELFITPLTEEEVDLDYSNYWNHSCDPNCLPIDEDHWMSVKDIKVGEQLTIDYCTFDCNKYDCIEECLCGSANCRKQIKPTDYKLKDVQDRYGNHFVPYILNKIKNKN